MIDAEGVSDERSLLQLYLDISRPEGATVFGRSRAAFRDAVLGGGPGWHGECKIVIVGSAPLRMIDGGRFHRFLEDLASESSMVRIGFE